MTQHFKILKQASDVLPFLSEIIDATNIHKDVFGFNPQGAYEEYAQREKLWVVTSPNNEYLGHLMLGGKPPQELRIFQIYVNEQSRKLKIASRLIDEAIKHAEMLNCLNLRADVANDLTGAIRFWQAQGFCALAPRRKQNTTGRKVLIFFKRLSTPSLLPQEVLPLNIEKGSTSFEANSYVIDLNIFLTLVKEQANAGLISEIMQAAIGGEFSLFVTPEFQAELLRFKREVDPIFDLAQKALPVLSAVDENELTRLEKEIRSIVFPDRSLTNKKAANDKSDLRHLAYCVKSGVHGFITLEKAIIQAKDPLSRKYGLNIYSPYDFQTSLIEETALSTIVQPIQSSGSTVIVQNASSTEQLRAFFNALGSSYDGTAKIILKNKARGLCERKIIQENGVISAIYVAQTYGAKHDNLEGFFVFAPGLSCDRSVMFQHVLESFIRLAQTINASSVGLYIQEDAFDLENICLARGFCRNTTSLQMMMALSKVPCAVLVTQANWSKFRKTFQQHTDNQLPELAPLLRENSTGQQIIQIARGGQEHEVELFRLETFLSPSLIMLEKRTGIILPIASAYAENLLSRSEDFLPFPVSEEALLRLEKVYYRSPTHTKIFSVGNPLVFYESGPNGRGVIGCGRVTSIKVVSCDNALKLYRNHGVFDKKEMIKHADKDGNIQVITFDNFKPFVKPISMKRLREIGCAKANMVSPEKVLYDQLYIILHEGLAVPTRDVLLSIQPDFVAKILSGKKVVELRKKPFPITGSGRIWIYSTAPTSAIEATAQVTSVDKDTPENIWQRFGSKCGISKANFDLYYADASEAYALHITCAQKLRQKMQLQKLKQLVEGFTPPQYYRYIDHRSDIFEELVSSID